MANICSNYLKVTGPQETAVLFLQRLKDGGFNAFIPQPTGLDDADVCDWRHHNWGDKWEIDPESSEFELTNLKARFDTAWNPPVAWFRYVAAEYPMLTMEMHYEESMNLLWGWLRSESETRVLTTATEEMLVDDYDDEEYSGREFLTNRAVEWYSNDEPPAVSAGLIAGVSPDGEPTPPRSVMPLR
jgi:hypothetical protein